MRHNIKHATERVDSFSNLNLRAMQKLLSFISFLILLLMQTSLPAKNLVGKILILGDSLSAAHNIAVDESWPVIFSASIRAKFPQATVINASISGETTFGGVSRLPSLLEKHKPSHLIIELGGNDGLRGLNFEQTTENLQQMLAMAERNNVATMVIGVRMPPNLGAAYNQQFQAIFETVTSNSQAYYLPRFLEGVAASDPALMQSDGIHPSALAQPILAQKVWNALQQMLSVQ